MITRLGFAAALAASVLLVSACASEPGTVPGAPLSTEPPETIVEEYPLEAAWLDDGRLFAVVTWGSSTCVPLVEDVTAEGQNVTVTFAEEEEARACTADYAPRASLAGLPEGVDPTEDVVITLVDPLSTELTPRVELDGQDELRGRGGESTEFEPSAGWFDDQGLVLLTWGSSSCPPVVEGIDEGENAATITFVTEDGMCTMDMAPRLTVLGFAQDHDDDDFVLTLDGGGFEGVTVRPIEN